jgi:hypothetical protein
LADDVLALHHCSKFLSLVRLCIVELRLVYTASESSRQPIDVFGTEMNDARSRWGTDATSVAIRLTLKSKAVFIPSHLLRVCQGDERVI